MAVHPAGQGHARKAALTLYAVDDRIAPAPLNRVLLPVGRVKIAAVLRHIPVISQRKREISRRFLLRTGIKEGGDGDNMVNLF